MAKKKLGRKSFYSSLMMKVRLFLFLFVFFKFSFEIIIDTYAIVRNNAEIQVQSIFYSVQSTLSLSSGKHQSVFYFYTFVILRRLYKLNHTVCNLLGLATFFTHHLRFWCSAIFQRMDGTTFCLTTHPLKVFGVVSAIMNKAAINICSQVFA